MDIHGHSYIGNKLAQQGPIDFQTFNPKNQY